MADRKCSTAALRRPDDTSSAISAVNSVSGGSSSPRTGGSNSTSFSIGTPAAAACRPSSPPEERP
jgi:hypothetical protein